MKMNKFNLTVIKVRLTICCCQCMSDFEIKATNRCYQSQAKISGLHILRLFTMSHVIRNNSILHRILQNKGLKQTDSLPPPELFLQNPSRSSSCDSCAASLCRRSCFGGAKVRNCSILDPAPYCTGQTKKEARGGEGRKCGGGGRGLKTLSPTTHPFPSIFHLSPVFSFELVQHGFRRHLGWESVAAKITANIWEIVQLSNFVTLLLYNGV